MDKGEWNLADYKFEKVRQENEIRRKNIEIQKWNIKKEELKLELDGIDLNISKLLEDIEVNKKSVQWCEDHIKQ